MKDLVWYFFKLGSFGFGGPAALVGYMRRDLVEDWKLIDESTYNRPRCYHRRVHWIPRGGCGGRDRGRRRDLPAGLFLHNRARALVPSSQGQSATAGIAAGATTAASGAIAGAGEVLGRGAISNLPTACIALTELVLLVRFRVPEPLLVLGAGLVGLALSRVAR